MAEQPGAFYQGVVPVKSLEQQLAEIPPSHTFNPRKGVPKHKPEGAREPMYFKLKAGSHGIGQGNAFELFNVSDPHNNVVGSFTDLALAEPDKWERLTSWDPNTSYAT